MRRKRGGYYRGYCGGSGGDLYGFLAIIILGIIAMPLVGGYILMTRKDEGSKVLGGVLLVVGFIIWIACGIH